MSRKIFLLLALSVVFALGFSVAITSPTGGPKAKTHTEVVAHHAKKSDEQAAA